MYLLCALFIVGKHNTTERNCFKVSACTSWPLLCAVDLSSVWMKGLFSIVKVRASTHCCQTRDISRQRPPDSTSEICISPMSSSVTCKEPSRCVGLNCVRLSERTTPQIKYNSPPQDSWNHFRKQPSFFYDWDDIGSFTQREGEWFSPAATWTCIKY